MKEQIEKALEKVKQGEDVFFVDMLGETYLLLDSPILVTTRRWATGESVLARSKEGDDCLVWVDHIEAICP
jgi:hypothetical protein